MNTLTDVFKSHNIRVINTRVRGTATHVHLHLNDFRFCDFDRLDVDLGSIGYQIDEDREVDVNELCLRNTNVSDV